jgi:hypothetical protein
VEADEVAGCDANVEAELDLLAIDDGGFVEPNILPSASSEG